MAIGGLEIGALIGDQINQAVDKETRTPEQIASENKRRQDAIRDERNRIRASKGLAPLGAGSAEAPANESGANVPNKALDPNDITKAVERASLAAFEANRLQCERVNESANNVAKVIDRAVVDYAKAGVREYWVIDPASKVVQAFTLTRGKRYRPIRVTDEKIDQDTRASHGSNARRAKVVAHQRQGEDVELRGLLPVKEASDWLAISPATCYRLMERGTLGSLKIGSARRIRLRDLQALIAHER
jgi:excisionase family DNA binding protein